MIFDHHQRPGPLREDGQPFSSFGLIWQHYGRDYLRSFDLPEADLEDIHRSFDQGFVLPVDLIDNGAGIDAASQELIFEKFSRLPGQGGEGAGLGLAICREIIKRLQGDISYLTEVSGTGFRVELPLAQNGACLLYTSPSPRD